MHQVLILHADHKGCSNGHKQCRSRTLNIGGSRGGSSTTAGTVVIDTVGLSCNFENRARADIIEVDQQPSRGTVPRGYIKVSNKEL
jgi:hypothetical protein